MGKLPFEKQRTVITRFEEQTDAKCGTMPHKRSIKDLLNSAVINIDKPSGPTTTQVSEWAKNILKVDSCGHTGTLDPVVTGCAPVAINEATKVTTALLSAGKEYVCLMRLHDEVKENDLAKAFKDFTGRIYQRPPLKSSVKRDLRIRTIYYIEPMEFKGKDTLFKVGCQAGTYIRRLCHDIGLALGCGAHMQQLRRTRLGPFDEKSLVTMQKLADSYYLWKEKSKETALRECLLPLESALAHLPRIFVSDSAVDALCHGAQLYLPAVSKLDSGISAEELVAVYTLKGEAILVGKAVMTSDEMNKKKKGQAVKTDRVLMKTGVYPAHG